MKPRDCEDQAPLSLILASASVYRKQLLSRLLDEFSVVPADVDESLGAGESAADATRRLSNEKSLAVSARYPNHYVLASDQLAWLRGKALGKPRSLEEAREQLEGASGQTLELYTAVILRQRCTRTRWVHVDRSLVTFRTFSGRELLSYLDKEKPLDCAGGLKLEGLGISLCKSIQTRDPTALIGLPLIATSTFLRRAELLTP